ncbi:MAG: antiactivator of flagellar biosynthesis FleN protein [Burkholderiales bacterium]|nr:antiactivator of flagellar biosynthesis FleN protein [Burkholderiales bacterium]
MLAEPKPRVLTFLSALRDDDKGGTLVNLAASLARQGNQVLMVDARATQDSIGAWLNARHDRTLLDVAKQQRTMQEAIKVVASGLSVTMLSNETVAPSGLSLETGRRLSRVFDVIVSRSDLVIVDSDLDASDTFPLNSLDDSEIVIQVSADPAQIKAAYGLIKRVSNRLGRREFGILVSGATESEARLVFANMSQAASRYLALPLYFIGHVPEDEHVKKAANLGRSVIDAFPLARASLAFAGLAEKLALSARSTLRLEGIAELGVGLGI